ncbi:cold shock domain-containing protein [Neisseria montereyensis]|uniref:Cold shock domain-containing protein n=1 Tax=Neisseria montereyensis TaxID=2973938 RepID=A0ABT2FF13_9NEIS|nr:cold shock domain-containing protein [Neisseria montereyensis]MCS4534108.1 cold shock domain-containing protein [Neisseria montereyensis]
MRWDYELGFGFIKEEQSKAEIFAHIGEFETENPPPRDGETVSFDIVSNQRGVEEAKNIQYSNRSHKSAAQVIDFDDDTPKNLPGWLRGMVAAIVGIPLLGAAAYYGLDYWDSYRASHTDNEVVVDQVAEKMMAERAAWKQAVESTGKRSGAGKFSCDGRQYCSQMKSFTEAKFFLAYCPNVKMDDDKDGIPCEDQFEDDVRREHPELFSGSDKEEDGGLFGWLKGSDKDEKHVDKRKKSGHR